MNQSPELPLQEITQPSSRLVMNQTIGYFAAFVGLGLTAASLGPTLPGLAAHTGSTIGEISFLFTARSFGYLLGSLRGGRAFDRLPGHPLMVTMLVGMATMMALVPVSSLLWLVTAVLFILGLAEGAVDVGTNTLLVWVHQQRVGPSMNALHFFFGFGAFLVPIIAAQALLCTNDINWVYWLLALYLLPVAFWLVRLPSPKAPAIVRAHQEKSILNPVLVGMLVLFFILYCGAESSFGGWVFTYATTLNLAGPAMAAYLTSIFWGVFTLGRLVGIPLAVRFSPQNMLVWDLVGCIFSIGLILLFPGSLIALGVGAAGLGFSMASMFPSMLVYAGQRMVMSGRLTSWFFVGAGIGAMILPWVIGQLFEKIGPQATMWIILFDLVAIGLLFVAIRLYNRRAKNLSAT
jgi:MFS transporter, FHS family, Na+ dependent glucose transporter 1